MELKHSKPFCCLTIEFFFLLNANGCLCLLAGGGWQGGRGAGRQTGAAAGRVQLVPRHLPHALRGPPRTRPHRHQSRPRYKLTFLPQLRTPLVTNSAQKANLGTYFVFFHILIT